MEGEEEEVVFTPDHYETKFDPHEYLSEYYSDYFILAPGLSKGYFSEALSDGTRLSLFALPMFARMIEEEMRPEDRQYLIDVGAGPTVYTAVCFRDVVKRVYLTDYLQKNLDVLRDWLDKKRDFDWSPLIRIVCRTEGEIPMDDKRVMAIEEQTRSVILEGGIQISDVHKSPCCQLERLPIQQFDVLVSVFCLESACTNYAEYCKAMSNMLELLRPGGRVIIGSVLDDDRYNSGRSTVFTLLRLTEEDIYSAAQANGIDMQTARKYVLEQEGVMFFIAKKHQHQTRTELPSYGLHMDN